MADAQPPKSATSALSALAGLLGLTIAVVTLRMVDADLVIQILVCLLATALPVIFCDLIFARVHRNPTTGLDFASPPRKRADLHRVATKLLGLYATWAVIGFFYWLLPFYHKGTYGAFLSLMAAFAPFLVIGAVPYFLLLDRYTLKPEDGFWQVGRLVMGRRDVIDRESLRQFAMAWAIKAFFLAFCFSILPQLVNAAINTPTKDILSNIPRLAGWLITIGFLVDVSFGTIGYIFTFRALDSHIRSSNPLLLGWLVALFCYPPINTMLGGGLLPYNDGQDWAVWLSGAPSFLLALWGATLVVLTGIYAWATVIFGIRFSNLTHRGIITNGPFRYTKHPAYIAKNLFWWLAFVPFLSAGGWEDALRASLLLAVVNLVYAARARTEEHHLMTDPVYQQYAAWIAEKGLLRKMRNFVRGRRTAAIPRPENSGARASGRAARL